MMSGDKRRQVRLDHGSFNIETNQTLMAGDLEGEQEKHYNNKE